MDKDYTTLYGIPKGIYFPEYIFNECNSAAIFFAALYQGKNDAIHFFRAGFKNVLINDIVKMDLMKKLYPMEWRYEEGDAFKIAKELDRTYDVVTCDTGMGDFLFKDFTTFYNIAEKYLCIFSNDAQFKKMDVDKNKLHGKMSSYHGFDIKIKEIFKRPDSNLPGPWQHLGNRYWVIIEKQE